MNKKKITMLSVLVAVTLTASIMMSFVLAASSGNRSIPIQLPTEPSEQSGEVSGVVPFDIFDSVDTVDISPQNVKAIIGKLTRPDSYSLEITVSLFWKEGSSDTVRRIWVKDGCTKVTRLSADGNAQENTIITKDRTYIWNDGNTQYYEGLNGSIYADDVLQIPTYENILNEDEAEIITASYENRSGEPCVYVQVADNEYGGIRGYWVSLDSGLLVAAEVY